MFSDNFINTSQNLNNTLYSNKNKAEVFMIFLEVKQTSQKYQHMRSQIKSCTVSQI